MKLTALITSITFLCTPALAEVVAIDGDTLALDGTTYRLNGIDAPEYGQKCKGNRGNWPCGKEALATLSSLLERGSVQCEAISEDGYGRTIATCFSDGIDVGEEMVLNGLAWAFVRYSDVYVNQEAVAQSENLGIWQSDNMPAWDYRAEKWAVAEQEAPEGCPIKGNISRNGRIYHPPWSPWYSRTKVSLDKGERWFCSEAEAVEAGWRAPRWQ
ncbi:thermonuclease family protein [Tateyamaria pelophila]|uniref:thermonuclease family protein n=1 Tax=Tateyamaria pelophila TaxID=328415 RepID=UPI001CBF6BA4|nr:thermonuclease family protein [Tateyamaria pelophila]